ncbi:microsomal glutathione S-transferase 1 [Strongylocentrotus purpuratus]|uniref:Microsomal glutathione S-transferase 1 n=1 Tax=Strongylocentrotus purpuratus TaxID=7668 RepID=A0A7M7FZV7_STRPU|nr:microsomal glutathione S-transferase 1 [Strongylocentrotus purpuratus]|eukprot:XP_001180933.2 PREDICTED: microsomal glutathione S-transferase 1 [Strongylocentrotus purpuratus]
MAVIESEELSYFATYVSIVILKMVVLSPLTGYFRHQGNAFSNPEDMVSLKEKDRKPIFNDPMVERVRRCHLNDLENIVPFFALGLLYALTSGASTTTIVWHYRFFVVARLFHTIAYIGALPQPSRGLGFLVGLVVNVSMAVQILMYNANF